MAALRFSQGACRAPARGILTTPSSRRAWQRPQQARRPLICTPAAARQPVASGSGSGSTSGGKGSGRRRGPRNSTDEPQPQLQAWLQREQGLEEEDADSHARRLVFFFKGNEAAALASLPATFAVCRGEGLSGSETQLLGWIGRARHDKVVNFTSTAHRDWELIDSFIRAHLRHVKEAGRRWPKHDTLASALLSSAVAAQALAMPPGHVAEWLLQVGERLTAEQLGAALLSYPAVVTSKAATALAAMDWAGSELGVEDVATFVSKNRQLLKCSAATLQQNLDSLQRAVGLTGEQARQLAAKQPSMLWKKPETLQGAAAWLRQRFPDPEQLQSVVQRGPQLLFSSAVRLQQQADALQQRLGWDSKRVARFISEYPQFFATVDLSQPDTAAKLLFLTRVVGMASEEECIEKHSVYLRPSLETMAAHYVLVQERAPHLLSSPDGSPSLSWVIAGKQLLVDSGILPLAEYRAHMRDWPKMEGKPLLAVLRGGSIEGWPLPPAELAEQKRQQWEAGAVVRAAKGTTAGKRRGRPAGRGRQGREGRGGGNGNDSRED